MTQTAHKLHSTPKTLPHREAWIKGFNLLVVEKGPGLYRLYVSPNGIMFCHYDSGEFENLDTAAAAIFSSFDPAAYKLFPVASILRDDVLILAPHASDFLDTYLAVVKKRR